MSRIRVMHVVRSLATGGTERGVRKLLAGLDRNLFEQLVCTVVAGPALDCETDTRIVSLGRAPQQTGFLVPDLVRTIRKEKLDIVHSRNWGTIEAVLAAKIAGVPAVIHSEHGRDLQTMGAQPLRRRVFRRFCFQCADRVFAVSRELRDYYACQLKFSADRITTIPNGVDTHHFRPDASAKARIRRILQATPGTLVVGTVARLDPVKDHYTLLRAVKLAAEQNPDILLVLVGDGPERAGLEHEVQSSKRFADRVRFVGESPEVSQWLNGLDVFVLPSLSEGMSNTLLEAMAVGVPTIATRVGGNAEVVEDEISGVLFTPGDVQGLAAQLLELASDERRREALAFGARRRIEACFSLDRMLAAYSQMYRELVGHEGMAQRLSAVPS